MVSGKASAEIESVDWSAALSMPGVVDKVDASDVPGSNAVQLSERDENIFTSGKVIIHIGVNLGLSTTIQSRITLNFMGMNLCEDALLS